MYNCVNVRRDPTEAKKTGSRLPREGFSGLEGHYLAGFNLIFETDNEPICQKQVEAGSQLALLQNVAHIHIIAQAEVRLVSTVHCSSNILERIG